MFNLAVLLIALGAVVGLYMAVQHFRGRTPPRGIVAATHGLLAVSGVIILLIAARETGLRGAGAWALWLFGVAALGGLYLATQHMDQKRLPNGVIVVHALVAVVAFLITLVAVYLTP
jgi:glucose uptake protein GlcU